MHRGLLIAAGAAAVVTALLSVIVNWATAIVSVPAWLDDPVRIVLVGAVLVLVLVVLGMVAARQSGAHAPLDVTPASASLPVATVVTPSLRPPPPGLVLGRDAELAALAAPHREPVLDVVCAGGGTGKTTLAREVARRYGSRSFWIDWRNDPEMLATSMVEVARTLGLPVEQVAQAQRTGASVPDLVWEHLESVRGWLVVVDNVDDVDSLQTPAARISTYRGWLRPTAAGRMLVTTRLQDAELWGPQARLHRIGRLTTDAAAAVLRDYAPRGGDAAEELAERLGGHPLALRAAGRAVGAPTSAWPTFAAYLAALRENRISVLPDAPHDTDPETARRLVGHTWEVSLDQLTAKPSTRLARPLLRALSLLAQAPIPRGLITPALLPDAATEQQVDAALDGLNRYGLLEPAAAPGTVLLHPLVRETSAAFLAREADIDEWRERVEDRVAAFVEETVAREREGWADARLLVPHVVQLTELEVGPTTAESPAGRHVRFDSTSKAAKGLAHQLAAAGRFELELEVWQRVLFAETQLLGSSHPDAVVSRGSFGWALWQVGDRAGGEEQLRHAVLLAQPSSGALLINARHNHALALMQLAAADEAVMHLDDIYSMCLTARGPDDQVSLMVRHHLALAVLANGDRVRGLEMLRDTLAADVRVLGTDHLQTARIRADLGRALGELGAHAEAAALHEQSMQVRAQQLGDEHILTLNSQHELAWNLGELGRSAQALDLARTTLAARERTLGPDHRDTAATRRLIADLSRARNSFSSTVRLRGLLRR